MNIFDGLLGYEKLMLLCGLILFVFALAAITAMIVQRRDFKMAMVLIVLAIVLMGFPGIQAVKFSQDTVELDRIRTQPPTPATLAQKQQAQQVLADLEQRAADNPQLQAQVADGYRAIGEVDKAYQLAQPLLQQKPSPQVQATLVPVLTAKLNQVQAGVPVATVPAPAADIGSAAPKPTASVAATPAPATTLATSSAPVPVATVAAAPAPAASVAATPPIAAPAATPAATAAALARQREIATIARQLQHTDAPLPATSHAALAKAYVVLGQPQKAQTNIDEARRLDPNIKFNPAVLRAARVGGHP